MPHLLWGLWEVAIDVFLQRWRLRHLPQLDGVGGPAEGLTAIVTGPTRYAYSGIGREIALELARRGATVILACRSRDRGERLSHVLVAEAKTAGRHIPEPEVQLLDLSSLRSVRAFAAAWGQRPLHLLFNNAGIFDIGGTQQYTQDGFEAHIGTNYLGHFLLTLLLLPALHAAADKERRPAAARVVSVASKLHLLAACVKTAPGPKFSALHAYNESKLAQVQITAEMRRRAKTGSVAFFSVDPGESLTDIVRNRWLARPYQAIMQWILVTPPQGARSSLYCATAPADQLPGLGSPSQSYYGSACRPVATPAVDDAEAGARLWQWSEQQVGWKGPSLGRSLSGFMPAYLAMQAFDSSTHATMLSTDAASSKPHEDDRINSTWTMTMLLAQPA